MSALRADTGSVRNTEERLAAEVKKAYTPFLNGDLLVAKITPCFENGKVAQAILDREVGFGSTEFHVVRALPNAADQRFLLHFLRQERVRREGELRMTGSAGQRRVPGAFLSGLRVPVLLVKEQRRIAEVLDRAEALWAKRRAALAKLDTLTQAIFLEMFGDPATNPRRWPMAPLSEIGDVITGNTPPRDNPGLFGTAIEWVKSDNLNTPYMYVTKATEGLSVAGRAVSRTVPAGSILVTCIAGTPACIGNAAIADREVAFNQQINAIVPAIADAHFLYMQIVLGKRLIRQASTGGMKGMVSKSRFERIRMVLPPLPLQHEFARRVAAVEKLKVAQRASLAQLDALFASLQHWAFRGEL